MSSATTGSPDIADQFKTESALKQLDQLLSSEEEGTFQQDAQELFDEVYATTLTRGHSLASLAAGVVYIAARKNDYPVDAATITQLFADMERNDVLKTRRAISEELELSIEPADPKGYVRRYAATLDADDMVLEIALDILETVDDTRVSNASPNSQAAAALYAAVVLEESSITQSDISTTANLSEVTIRTWYSRLLKKYHSNMAESKTLSPEATE